MKTKLKSTLLVDDDMVSNFVSERIIKSSNITEELKIVSNGHVALKLIEKCVSSNQSCPELIFLDINMPVMDAFDFLYLYNRIDKKNKGDVVILTSSDNPHDIEHLSQFEIVDYINKPLTKEKMESLTQKLQLNKV